MNKLSNYRVLLAGILTPFAAAALGLFTYATLTRASTDRNQDFVFRLTAVTVVMIVPSLVTLALFIGDRRRRTLNRAGKIGLVLATLSLGLTWVPARGLIARMQRNAAVHEAPAPLFEAVDIFGKQHRLQDDLGKVVVINAWATWCTPCKEEMPALDRMYQNRKNEGLMVYGLSTEDVELQRKFAAEKVPVTYPLLTTTGSVPGLYRNVERWPSIFLVDRKGRLRAAPPAGQQFSRIEEAVDSLLKEP